jgi:outer membrane protein OmpA-like peptidoglycan-associated protein
MLARTIAIAAVGLTALLFSPLTASAQEAHKGVYIGAGAGINFWPEDSDLGSNEAKFDDWDWTTAGQLGYAFGNGFRAEGEFGYRPNDVDSVSNVTGASGDLSTMSFMANLLYDFHIGNFPLTPYIGVGIGAARVHADGVAPANGVSIDDSSIGFAMQGILGVSYDITPNWALKMDYRHIRVPDLEFDTSAGTSVDSDYATNEIMVGFRYTFGAPAAPAPTPAPAAAPAPAPEPAPKAVQPKEFLVFFDFDSAKLTPEAQDIIKSAVTSAKDSGAARIVLTGHADRAGPATYNLGLSQRRAEAVKDELVRQGITSAEITTQAKGETEPLVATADGVAEPQNRRVEIVIR